MLQQFNEDNDRTVLRNYKRNIKAVISKPIELLESEEDNLVRTIQLSRLQRIQIISEHEDNNNGLLRQDNCVQNDPKENSKQGGQKKSISALKNTNENDDLCQSIENSNHVRNNHISLGLLALAEVNQTNNQNGQQSKNLLQKPSQDSQNNQNQYQKISNNLPENYPLEVIRDGRFNLGGVRLEIDFQKKLVKAVKQVKFQDHFEREVRMLKTLADNDVSLQLLDVDNEKLTFVQRGGFISLKRVSKIIEFKDLQNKYRLPFEFFLIKQLDFLLEKLNTLNNACRIAHGDIKPNNIVLGFDFISYFIDFGGAIFYESESEQYLNLCTPTFIMPEFLQKESFSEKDIKRCEKMSLFLTFLFLLCRDKKDKSMFFAREYSNLMNQLRTFYSNDLIDAFEGYLLGGLVDSDLEQVVQNLVEKRIVQQMEMLEESEMFLRELKQFDYQNGVYIVKEWDQFNTNVLKLFPELNFEVDLMEEISEKKQLFLFLQDNKDKQLFVNTAKVFYNNLVNCFISVAGSDCQSLKIQHLNGNDTFRICDILEYKDNSMQIRVDFNLSSSQLNYLEFERLQDIKKLEIIGNGIDIQSQFLTGFASNSKIEEFKLKCGDVNISKFQELLINQTNLQHLHVRISQFQYNIEIPKLNNQLRKLKCNCQISNLQQVITENKESLEVLELVISEGQSGLNEILQSILILSKLSKLSLKVQYLKLNNQQQSQAKSTPVLSEEFYSFLYCCFSEKQISTIKLNFAECNLNSFDAVQLARVIKATQLQFPHILKLKIVQPSKPIDDKSTQVILGAVFQSKLIRSKISLTNKPATSIQTNSIAVPLKLAECNNQGQGWVLKDFKSTNIQQISMNLNYFPPKVLQLLSLVQKVKLLFSSSLIPPQFLKINSFTQDASQPQLQIQKQQQQVILKPTNPSLNDAFSQINPQSSQITIRQKLNKNDYPQGNSIKSSSKSNLKNIRNLQNSIIKSNKDKTSIIDRKVEDYIDFQFDYYFASKSTKLSNTFKKTSDQHNNNLCALTTSLGQVHSSLKNLALNCNVGSLPRYFSHNFLNIFFENLAKHKSIEILKLSVPFGITFDSKSDGLRGLKEFITNNISLRQFDLELKGCSLGEQAIMRLTEAFQDKNINQMSLTISLIDCQDVDQSMIVEMISQLNQQNLQLTLLISCLLDYDTFIQSIIPSFSHCQGIKLSTNNNDNTNIEFFKDFEIFPQDQSKYISSLNSKLPLTYELQSSQSARPQNHLRALTENHSPHIPKSDKLKQQLIYNHQIAQIKTLYPQSFQSLSPQLSSDKSPTVFSQTSKNSKFSLESNIQHIRSLSSQRKKHQTFSQQQLPNKHNIRQNIPSGFASLPNKINFPSNHLRNNLPCILQYKSNSLTLITDSSSKIPSLECVLNPHTNLTNIEISFSQQSLDIRDFLSSMKQHICLQSLSLIFGFQISKQEIELLSEAIKFQPKLNQLNLNLNHAKLHSVNLKIILESISTLKALRQLFLDISFNAIQPKGAKYFEVLTDIPNLEDIHINLSNNFLGLEGIQGISKFISQLSDAVINLSLGLDFNFIGENALKILRTAISSKNTLQLFSVSLRGNQIRQEEAASLQASLSSQASVCTFSIITDPMIAQ